MPAPQLPFFVSVGDAPAKQAILAKALELFASRGVDGVSIRDIAAAAGFSNPAMFKHFKTKEDLARTLFESCYRRLVSNLVQSPVGLATAISRSLDLIETSPESVHFVLENFRRYWRDLPEDARKDSLLGATRRLIEREQSAGRIRDEIDPRMGAVLVLGLIGQIARMAHFNELPRPLGKQALEILELLNRGLGA